MGCQQIGSQEGVRRGNHRWAIFISGRGSNMQAILDCLDEFRVVLVISNSSEAPGLKKAQRLGVPVYIMKKTSNKKLDWDDVDDILKKRGISRIFLAGFMRLIPGGFIEKWKNRILNVHPSLLPEFPGLHAIEKSYEAKASMGVTVHVVIPEMDAGPIVLQKLAVPSRVLSNTDLTLSECQILITQTEHLLVREAVRRWN